MTRGGAALFYLSKSHHLYPTSSYLDTLRSIHKARITSLGALTQARSLFREENSPWALDSGKSPSLATLDAQLCGPPPYGSGTVIPRVFASVSLVLGLRSLPRCFCACSFH